jgi:hypothetical protein
VTRAIPHATPLGGREAPSEDRVCAVG